MNRLRLRRFAGLTAIGAAVALLLAGCASGGAAPAATSAPDVPPAPVKKPFEPPAWEAQVYQNDEIGFSIHYPADFGEQPANAPTLFTAASPNQVPRVDINSAPATPGATPEAVAELVAAGLATVGGGEATVKEAREAQLVDEVTPAFEAVIDWTFQGFPLQSFVVGAVQGDSTITVIVTGMQGGPLEELSEVAYTLYFD